jgi:putative transcriptional regulator
MEPKAGDLLIAEPFMKDSNFKRSVVLLCDHNEDGSFGLVLNRKLDLKVNDVMPEFPGENVDLYYGGPVGTDTLHFIHSYGDLIEGSVHLKSNIYWSGNFEQIKLLFETNSIDPVRFRFFIGYSGWGEQQLASEMKTNSWMVASNFDNIFVAHEKLWQLVLKSMGSTYQFVSTFPEDPQLN